jgi:outer membrane protein
VAHLSTGIPDLVFPTPFSGGFSVARAHRRPRFSLLARFSAALVSVWLAVGSADLQAQTDTLALSLDEALELARRNNPTFLASANDADVANWEVRAAYGQLVPSANVSGGLGWQGTGEQLLGGNLTLGDLGVGQQPNFYSSNYRLGLNYSLSGSVLLAPSQAKASRRATLAQVDLARVNLETTVTQLYLDALRQRDGVSLIEQQLERARFNLRLAQAQSEVGQATPLDVTQAEVQVGRSEVALLQARNAVATAGFRLLQQLGMPLGTPLVLTTSFDVSQPGWQHDELLNRAVARNPTLAARRYSREAAKVGVRSARSAYLPSLNLSVGWSGFTREASNNDLAIAQAQASVSSRLSNCQATNELYSRLANPLPARDCSIFTFTDADRQAIIAANDVFPFSFATSPPTASLSLSLPIFQGLNRQRQVEQAKAQLDDTEYQLREQELALEAEVAINLEVVRTAFSSVQLEERNQSFANEQLRLARERYQAGLIPFLDLVEAETLKVQADRDLLIAIYAFHDALNALEAVVGEPLRSND